MTTKNTVKVTVVVPCFNRADTVEEAIQSVLDQDWKNLEVITVDDQSTDATLDVVQSIEDPRLRVVQNTDGSGVSSARNLGITLAALDAEWIAFQDSDDVWLPGKLSAQMTRLLDRPDYVASFCGMEVKADTDPNTPVHKRYPDPAITPLSGDILPSLVLGSYLSTQMLVIRRDVLDRLAGFDEDLQALVDWELMLRVAQEGPVDFVDENLVVQRMSDNSITRSSRKRVSAQQHILSKHRALLVRYPDAHAHHNHRIAGALRAFQDYKAALPFAQEAARKKPGNLKYLANFLYLQMRSFAN